MPSAAAIHTCDPPSRVERNAIEAPSGDQRAVVSFLAEAISLDGAAPPPAETAQISVCRRFFARSVVVRW